MISWVSCWFKMDKNHIYIFERQRLYFDLSIYWRQDPPINSTKFLHLHAHSPWARKHINGFIPLSNSEEAFFIGWYLLCMWKWANSLNTILFIYIFRACAASRDLPGLTSLPSLTASGEGESSVTWGEAQMVSTLLFVNQIQVSKRYMKF